MLKSHRGNGCESIQTARKLADKGILHKARELLEKRGIYFAPSHIDGETQSLRFTASCLDLGLPLEPGIKYENILDLVQDEDGTFCLSIHGFQIPILNEGEYLSDTARLLPNFEHSKLVQEISRLQ